jgi:hypothetical protein
MIIMLVPLYLLYELGIVLLWLAPASAVAEGRVLTLGRSDKAVARSDQPRQTAHSSAARPPAAHPGASLPDDDRDAV